MFDVTLIIAAVAVAMVYVVSSYGLVVTYRVGGVFNFALGYQAAIPGKAGVNEATIRKRVPDRDFADWFARALRESGLPD